MLNYLFFINSNGINIDGKWLSNLRFADDVVLTSQKAHEVQQNCWMNLEQLVRK